MFVVAPDDETENFDQLTEIKRIETFMKETGDFRETSAKEWEKLIFGNDNYLEENAFATSHQNVNVYGLPEKRYEIRSEETALDVQVYRELGKRE